MQTTALRHNAFTMPYAVYGPGTDDPLVTRLADLYDEPAAGKYARKARSSKIVQVLAAMSKSELQRIAALYRERSRTTGERTGWALSFGVVGLSVGLAINAFARPRSKMARVGVASALTLASVGLGLLYSSNPVPEMLTPEDKAGLVARNYLNRWF